MIATKKQISKNRIKFSISVDPEKMEEYFEKKYQQMSPSVTLPGFRSGKAPRAMTIEAIGHTRLAQGAVQDAMSESYNQALTEHKVYPVTQPNVTVSKHPAFGEDKGENELVFEIEFDILPEAKIGNYKKLKVGKVDATKLVVTDEEVEKVVDYLARQGSTLTELTRVAKTGDWAEISFKGSLDNVVLEKLTSQNLPIVIGETNFIPGFQEEIIGMKKGENKEFNITFPKDFQDKQFAGKKVKFELNVISVKEIVLPKIDNEFVKKFGRKSVPDLKKAIKESLVAEKQEREKQSQRAQIAEQLINITKVDLPKSLIEEEKVRMRQALEEDLQKKGTNYDAYIKELKMTEEKMGRDLEEQAKRNILLGVGIGEVAKAEGIIISSGQSTNEVFDRIIELNSK
jgi:trigger factor